MNIKEKFSNLPIDVFGYSFSIYYLKNDNTFWYEIIANKNDKEYFVCKLDYAKTNQGIRAFLLKDVANDLKEKYKHLDIKAFKVSIKLNEYVYLKKNKYTFKEQLFWNNNNRFVYCFVAVKGRTIECLLQSLYNGFKKEEKDKVINDFLSSKTFEV